MRVHVKVVWTRAAGILPADSGHTCRPDCSCCGGPFHRVSHNLIDYVSDVNETFPTLTAPSTLSLSHSLKPRPPASIHLSTLQVDSVSQFSMLLPWSIKSSFVSSWPLTFNAKYFINSIYSRQYFIATKIDRYLVHI